MCCKRCNGLIIERYGACSCINCGHDPDMVLITVKCASVECRQLPEISGYCSPCWHSRKRSELTDQERSKRYRERMREKQRTRRARKKGAVNEAERCGVQEMQELSSDGQAHQ